ncbi:FAD binding domain containing protein [Neofusicoccum parvum]|nr:FAD binding domain containing protein [Neofusicoccum parvum]
MYPCQFKWKTMEWFGRYQVGQRVSTRFMDDRGRVFICGDASHTHSPKAAQGMNTSIHDAWNLAWKLNLAVRKLAKPELLATFESERRKVAQDLIHFDEEHANAFAANDWNGLAQSFTKNVRFISGVVGYEPNILNRPTIAMGSGDLKPGCLPTPARVTRYADANPTDIQLDIPILGQFRIYFFCNDPVASRPFIEHICKHAINSRDSFTGRMSAATNASYTLQPPAAVPQDEYICPERYTPVSCLFTWALVTGKSKAAFEIVDLPQALRDSVWTVYLDDIPRSGTGNCKKGCIEKWLGGLQGDETAVVIVRPDGYVGTLRIWQDGRKEYGQEALRWMDGYFEGFLTDDIGATN